MKLKAASFSALFALAVSAFAGDPAQPASVLLDSLIPKLAAPIGKESLQWQNELEKLSSNAARPGAEAERAAFAGALCAKVADPGLEFRVRALLIRQLMLIGRAESVDALAKLLADSDPKICESARAALEKNPAPQAGSILLAALKKGGDIRWQIGLINSLGERRDSEAVVSISEKLSNAETSAAAASALGKIASPAAVGALQKIFAANVAAGDALIVAAQRLRGDGKNADAAAICAGICASQAAPQLRSAALDILATTGIEQAKKWIPAALDSDEVRLQTAAVSAALAVYGSKDITAELAPQLAQLKPAAKLAALRVVDASAESQVIALADDPDVSAAVIETLGRIGSASGVSVLLRFAKNNPREQTPLGAALSTINGPGAEEAIGKAAASGDSKSRAFAITVLGWRASKSAAPALVKYAAEPDPAVSRAACIALKSAGTDAEMMPLIQLVMAGKAPNAATAVRSIASRMTNRQSIAGQVIDMARGSTGAELIRIFEILSLVGGPDALKTLVDYTHSGDPQVAEGAVRALCKWPEFDGVEALLAIGADPKMPEPQRILALRAIEGIVLSSTGEPPAKRVDAAMRLLKTATRDEEKGLAVSILGSIPSKAAADALLPLIADNNLKDLACLASLNLAEKLSLKRDIAVARKLALAVEKTNPAEPVSKRAKDLLRTSERN